MRLCPSTGNANLVWLAHALTAVEEDREYRSLIHAELGFEADGGVAPEWLPERSHDSGRQSNAAVDIGLKLIGSF